MGPVPRSSAKRWLDVFGSSLKKKKRKREKKEENSVFLLHWRERLRGLSRPACLALPHLGARRGCAVSRGCAPSPVWGLPMQRGAQGSLPCLQGCCCPVEVAGGASRDHPSARRGETRRKRWIWGLESIRGTLRSHSPKRVEIMQDWDWKGLADFCTRPGAVPLTWRWEGWILGCWQSRGAGDPLVSRGAPWSRQRGLLVPLPRACWTEDVCEILEGLRMPPPPRTMDGAAQQKSGAPAFEDETIHAFSLPALRVPNNCLLDLAPATAETFALPGRSCIWR